MTLYFLPLFLLFAYAQFSHPWPRNPGLPEFVTAFMLLLMLLFFELIHKKSSSRACLRLYKATLILMVVTSVSGLLGIIFNSSDIRGLIRDFLPNLFYLIIPCCVNSLEKLRFKADKLDVYNTIIALLFIFPSFIIAYRAYTESAIDISLLGSEFFRIGQTFRQYDPFVTFIMAFTPFYLIYSFKNFLFESKIVLKFFYFFSFTFCIVSFILCSSTLIAIGQRAPMVYPIIGFLVLILTVTKNAQFNKLSPILFVTMLVSLALFLLVAPRLEGFLVSVFENFETKNYQTGFLDQKFIEFFSILSDPLLLFPQGFGSSYSNLAIGGHTLRFTHSAFSYFYLKFGLCGFLVLCWYMYELNQLSCFSTFLFNSVKSVNLFQIGLFYSFLCTLFSALALQPTYKTLGFTLLVSLVLGYVMSCVNYSLYIRSITVNSFFKND